MTNRQYLKFTVIKMNNLPFKQKPYQLLLLSSIAFLLASVFVLRQNDPVDIHVHDTYYVMAKRHIFWFLAIISLLVWTLYLLVNKILYSHALTWIHVITTILTIALFTVMLFFGGSLNSAGSRPYQDYGNWNSWQVYEPYAKTIATVIGILLIGQVLLVINIIAGLFKRWT